MSSSSVIFYSAVLPRNATVSERNESWLAISQRAPSGVCDEYRYRHGKLMLGFHVLGVVPPSLFPTHSLCYHVHGYESVSLCVVGYVACLGYRALGYLGAF